MIIGFALFTRNNAHAIGRRAHPILARFQVLQRPGAASGLQILAPRSGQKISNNAVTIRWALRGDMSVQSVPTFQLRLDADSAVRSVDTSYQFTGLALGAHTVRIDLLDANSNPVPNTFNEVRFTIVQPGTTRPGDAPPLSEASTMPEPGYNSLSLMGIIGFGVLVGGALSLYRTRAVKSQKPDNEA
ncbi:MAG: hypothetical protein ABI383_01570 [Acidobacteriaceae bacterium]